MSVRKNFIFREDVAKHLEELSKIEGKTQTQIIQEAIEKLYKEIEKKKKLTILNEIKGSFTGLLTNVDAKEARVEHAVKKYGK